ncbi:cytochrome c-type biogenesis protein CcsB [Pseudonocardia hierapolitana]|uniref:Cytochrome c-type biogenesis protein CcsB n=1 Tax=Pseudonocardia hierapolitana TaxID=1128676 RepID=A0A561STC3_9PSEU|nr:c-type cytochrome biogenesis protein CcsB [Pseudonocardia hierapolitana]TWF78124.1 cytochrome c-type biogenesis protein CcsB [Pseudonocardia hierapolitana]
MLVELATTSDRLFVAAAAVYALAMIFHAVEFAAARAQAPVLVGAGGADDAADHEPVRSRPERFGRMAVAVTVLGAVLHLASIATRGIAAERWPMGNMYEFISAITLAAVVTWLVVLRRSPTARPAGPFVLFPVLVLMALAGSVLYAPAGPVVPPLRSYWMSIHVSTISVSSGLLIVSGVVSLLFLLRRSGWLAAVAEKLPAADALDRLAYRVTIVAFPLFTFAIITGAIWAEAAWGRFWGWDPKETVAFVSWVIYAAYLHARATAGWRTGRAAWVNVAGFATIIFNLFFINMVVAGLHSYAGVG